MLATGAADAASASLKYVLVVVDGTWQQAKEMFGVLQHWLLGPGGCAVQVQLPLTHAHHSSTAAAEGAATQELNACGKQPAALQEQEHIQSLSGNLAAAAAATDVAAGVASLSLQPDPTCRLRTEPHEGCTTTYEAIAQAVSHLEALAWRQQQQQCGDGQALQTAQQHCGDGQTPQSEEQQQQQQQAELLAALLRPLQLMTQLQASFDPAVKARSQQGSSCVAPTRTRLGLGRSVQLQAVASKPTVTSSELTQPA